MSSDWSDGPNPWERGPQRDRLITVLGCTFLLSLGSANALAYAADQHNNGLRPADDTIRAEDVTGSAREILEQMEHPVTLVSREGEIVQFGIVDDGGASELRVAYVVVPRPGAEKATAARWSEDSQDQWRVPRAGLGGQESRVTSEISGVLHRGFATSGGKERAIIAGVTEPLPVKRGSAVVPVLTTPRGQDLRGEELQLTSYGQVQPLGGPSPSARAMGQRAAKPARV